MPSFTLIVLLLVCVSWGPFFGECSSVSRVACLAPPFCEVDDDADGDVDAADDGNLDVAAIKAAGVDDAVDDVASIITTYDKHQPQQQRHQHQQLDHQQHQTSVISSIKSTIRMILNHWQNVE